jgi:hypothetical protein
VGEGFPEPHRRFSEGDVYSTVGIEADRGGLEAGHARGVLPEQEDEDRAEAAPRRSFLPSQQAPCERQAFPVV